jgi:hypothetical protein
LFGGPPDVAAAVWINATGLFNRDEVPIPLGRAALAAANAFRPQAVAGRASPHG